MNSRLLPGSRAAAAWVVLIASMVLASSVGAQTVNLLEDLSLRGAAIQGSWSMTDQGLRVNPAAGARLMFPNKPGQSYDLAVTFTRQSGVHSVAVFFPTSNGQGSLEIDAWGRNLAGFQVVDGQPLSQRRPVVSRRLRNNQTYQLVLQVRDKEIRAYLDGDMIDHQRLDEVTLSMLDMWSLPRTDALGVGAFQAATIFHKVLYTPRAGNAPMPEPSDAQEEPKPSRQSEGSKPSQENLSALSDEFDDASSLDNWQRVFREEKSPADQLQKLDISQSRHGWLTAVPHSSSWYQDYRGVLLFKPVTGDMVVTMHVKATGRDGESAPGSQFSLAGIMLRQPRDVSPTSWRPGGENYVFLSVGAANQPGRFQYEVKTTVNSDSQLAIAEAPSGEATLRVVRAGDQLLLLRKAAGEDWVLHQRYRRRDFPATLQVGLTTYTDWPSVQRLRPQAHNTTRITGGNPDLQAQVDYIRFAPLPKLPDSLQGKNLGDASQASDADILQWLSSLE